MWSVQLLESIVKRIFYRFWKTFFQSGCIFAGKSISGIKPFGNATRDLQRKYEFLMKCSRRALNSDQLQIFSHMLRIQCIVHSRSIPLVLFSGQVQSCYYM